MIGEPSEQRRTEVKVEGTSPSFAPTPRTRYTNVRCNPQPLDMIIHLLVNRRIQRMDKNALEGRLEMYVFGLSIGSRF